MSEARWFEEYAPMAVPCPKCAGKVVFGTNYTYNPHLGGDPIEDVAECRGCGKIYTSDDAPADFFTPDHEYWNIIVPTGGSS